MASLAENIDKFTDIVQDWQQNIGDVFLSDEAADIDIKVLNDDGDIETVTIPNRQKLIDDFDSWKDDLNLKNDDGTLKDGDDNPVNTEKFGGKSLEQWEDENTVPLNRLLINPDMKQGRGIGYSNIILQTLDLKTIIVTGNNDDGYIIYDYGSGAMNGFKTIPSPNPGVRLKKLVYCGADTPVLLFEDNKLYGWGRNTEGQLGLGHTNHVLWPTFITDDVIDIESSNQADAWNSGILMAVKSDGSLWVAGDNISGQLGVGDTTDRTTLTLSWDPSVHDDEKVVKIWSNGTTDRNSTGLLTDAGNIYLAGKNNNGQLGTGNTTDQDTWFSPSLNQDHNFIDFAMSDAWDDSSDTTTVVVTDEGRVFATGDNTSGQVGNDSTDDVSIFTEITYPEGYDADNDPFVKVFSSAIRSFHLLTDGGDLYAVGRNAKGVLGTGDTDDRHVYTKVLDGVTRVIENTTGIDSYGHERTIILKDDGIYCSGNNAYGNLGLGHNSDISSFTKMLFNQASDVTNIYFSNNGSDRLTTFIATKQGLVYSCGDSYQGQNNLYSTNGEDTSNVVPSLFN